MRPEDAADLVRKRAVPWDEVRAARVQRRVLAEVREARERGEASSGGRRAGAGPRPRSFVRPLAWAAAAAALIGALVVIVIAAPWRGGVAATTRLDFADGSFVVMEGVARVVPSVITAERIEVVQSMGGATYDVAPRPERAFVVRIEDVRVEVLGTMFRVEPIDAAVRVSVLRGRVRVSRGAQAVSLVAGEEVTLGTMEPGEAEAPSGTQAGAVGAGPAEGPPAGSAQSGVGSEQPVAASASPTGSPSVTASASGSTTASGSAMASASAVDDPGPAELFRRADSARAAGNTAEALRLLGLLVSRHPRDGRRPLAVFTMARLEAQRGNHARAAAAFESLGSAFEGEALAEAALAHSAAGQGAKARALAERYVAQFPEGPRARQLARLVE